VVGLRDATQLSVGYQRTCARRLGGTVVCWGSNQFASLGAEEHDGRTPVTELDFVVDLAVGWRHSCARLASGAVRCWGANESGQLGDGSLMGAVTPVYVRGLTSVVELSTGGSNGCVRHASGRLSCWGSNTPDRLGFTRALSPVASPTIVDAVEVDAGGHGCARRATGAVVCWGRNGFGQLGNGRTRHDNTAVEVLPPDEA